MTPGTSYSPPQAFGRFRLLHQIGAGVLGPVFRTNDEQEQRLVAVKAFTLDITPERAEDLSNYLQQVVDIDLEHPHIARPIATGVVDSVAYLAAEYVAGESLDAAIRQYGPAPVNDAARLIGHVAEALDVAASVGVFHGALHPRDVLVTPGETHVTGLGISMALERIGQHGPIRRPYAAPEREAGQEWGAAADVFSLAVIAYEVLTGRRALPGTEQPLPGLADLQVRDAAALREILEAAIDAEPGRRPAKAGEFALALAAAVVDANAAHTPGERGSGGRRKIKPRPPKLPGLDDPLAPAEAAPVQPPAPSRIDDAPSTDQPQASVVSEVAAPGAGVETRPEEAPSKDVAVEEATAQGAPSEEAPPEVVLETQPEAQPETQVEAAVVLASDLAPVVDWDAAEALSDRHIDVVSAVEHEPIALEMDVPPSAESVPAISSDQGRRAGASAEHVAEADGLRLLLAPEPVSYATTPTRIDARDVPADGAEDTERSESDLTVPRALDPTRDADSFTRSPHSFESGQDERQPRSYGPVIVAAVAVGCLLVGLFGGYQMGARWGQKPAITPAQAVVLAQPTQPPVAPVQPAVPAPVAAAPAPAPQTPVAPAQQAQPTPVVTPPATTKARPEVPTAVATAPPTKAVPAVTEGRISVRTVPPGAAITLDGENAGKTPATLRKLPLGAHVVRVMLPGYVAQERKATITAARPAVRLDVTLRKVAATTPPAAAPAGEPKPGAASAGAIAFTTRPPGARVILDGKDVGLTPLTMSRVEPGRHTIELRLAGYRPWTTSIMVTAGKPQRVTASLERDNRQ